jgi:hypothetical protein
LKLVGRDPVKGYGTVTRKDAGRRIRLYSGNDSQELIPSSGIVESTRPRGVNSCRTTVVTEEGRGYQQIRLLRFNGLFAPSEKNACQPRQPSPVRADQHSESLQDTSPSVLGLHLLYSPAMHFQSTLG